MWKLGLLIIILYGYESSQLVVEQSRFIRLELKVLFPSANIITAEALAVKAW